MNVDPKRGLADVIHGLTDGETYLVKTIMKFAGLNVDPKRRFPDVIRGLNVDPKRVLADVIRSMADR